MLAAAGVASLVLASCGSTSGSGSSSSAPGAAGGSTYPIGFLLTSSGQAAYVGQQAQAGAQIAIDEINAAGGIGGKKISGDFEDTQLTPTLAVSELNKMISVSKTQLFIAQATPVLLAVKPIAKTDKVVIINHAGIDPTIADGPNYMFTSIATADQEGPPLANYIVKTGGDKTIATLTDDSSIGKAAAAAMTSAMQAAGGSVVDEQSFVKGSATDFRAQLIKIKQKNPQGLFIAPNGGQGAANILSQAKETGFTGHIYSNTFFQDPTLPTLAGSNANGVVYSYVGFDPSRDAAAKALQTAWNKKIAGAVPIYAATSYDAVKLYAAAIGKVGYDATKVRDYILSEKDFQGATGSLVFNAKGQASMPIELNTVKNGAFVSVSNG